MNIQSVTYSWSNDRTTNDTLNMTINDGYDISVSNVSVSPGYIYTNGTSQTVYYNVTYDAKLTVPSYVYSGPAYSGSSRIDDYQTLAKTSITIKGYVTRR
jgi:hypothetical protein